MGGPVPHKDSTNAFLAGRSRSASLRLGDGKNHEAPLGLLEQPPIWEGREALLLPGGARSPGSPCGLHWFCGEGREDRMCHPCLVGREIPAPYVSLSVTTLAGVVGCLGTA